MPELAIMARSMIAARRALATSLPPEFTHDPALDLLLHAFVAQASGRAMPVSDLTNKTTVATSVAQRWVMALVDKDLMTRSGENVVLSDKGLCAVMESLRAVSRSQWKLDDIA